MLAPEDEARFCIRCGTALTRRIYAGQERPLCPACGWVFFPDPKVAVAVVVLDDQGRVLLVRRRWPPQAGRWTLPAGFMNAGEDPAQAAVRECWEETGLRVQVTEPPTVLSVHDQPGAADVLIVYPAHVLGGHLQAADDVDRAAFFAPDALPPLAFASTARILARYLSPQDIL